MPVNKKKSTSTMTSNVEHAKSLKVICIILICLAFFYDQTIATSLLPVLPNILRNLYGLQISRSAQGFNMTDLNHSLVAAYVNNAVIGSVNLTETNFSSGNVSAVSVTELLGIMFGLRGLAQLVSNPLCGLLIDFTFPLLSILIGLAANSISQIIFAFSDDIVWLCLSRCFQGLGAAAILTGCFSQIAEIYKSPGSRRKVTAFCNIFTFLGGAVGPVFGGAMYLYCGRIATFFSPLAIAGISFALMAPLYRLCRCKYKTYRQERCDEVEPEMVTNNNSIVLVHECVEENREIEAENRPVPIYKLIIDPYILTTTVGLAIVNLACNTWFPTLPSWMNERFKSSDWEQGIVWAPSVVFYIFGTWLITRLCRLLPTKRFLIIIFAFLNSAVSTVIMPFVNHWIAISLLIGINVLSAAMIEVALIPMLANIVDARYSKVYGSVSSLVPTAFSLTLMFGSFAAGFLTAKFGFAALNIGVACVYAVYSPFVLLLRRYC